MDECSTPAPGSSAMSTSRCGPFRPSLLGLEARQLMAAELSAHLGQASAGAPAQVEAFDPYLNVSFQEGYQGKYLQVDGSDYDDVVKVLDYRPGTNGLVSLQLEQYSGGVQLSSRVVRYHANFTTSYPVRVDAKGGNDTVVN